MNSPKKTDSEYKRVMKMIADAWMGHIICALIKLGVFDILHEHKKPQTAEEIAAGTDMKAPLLYRVLRAAARAGALVEDEQHRFSLNAISELFCTDNEQSFKDFLIFELGAHLEGWEHLPNLIKTGKNFWQSKYGCNLWEYYETHPEERKVFNAAMKSVSRVDCHGVLQAYDFSSAKHIIDIGGGSGGLLKRILQKYPELCGTLFDLPSVIEHTKESCKEENIIQRCSMVAGDFFEGVPTDGDLYLLKFIIHDWPDEKAIEILRSVRKSMPPHAKLLVLEILIVPEESFALTFDVNLLIKMIGGGERTVEQYQALFEKAQFKLERVLPTTTYLSIMECSRV